MPSELTYTQLVSADAIDQAMTVPQLKDLRREDALSIGYCGPTHDHAASYGPLLPPRALARG